MSTTQILTGDPYTAKLYAKKAWVQTMQKTVFGHVFNRGGVYVPDELVGNDARGDQITFNYFGKMTSNPVGEGGTMDGNEESLDIGAHNMVMNETRSALLIPARGIEPQRIKQSLDKVCGQLLPRRAAEFLDTSLFQQLAGVNPTSFTFNGTTYATTAQKLHVQGHNTPVAPSSNRIVRAGGVANDQSLTSSNTMTLALIDYALEKNASSDQPIEAFDDDCFDLYLSPYDITNLKHDAGSAIQWFNIQTAHIQGGSEDRIENMYKNGMVCAGKYNNVWIYQAGRVAYGANSSTSAVITTTRRNVLVGRDAVSFASPYGGRPDDDSVPMEMIEQLKDYKKYKGIGFEMVYGLKKMAPTNKEDTGVFVLSTYAAAHA
jgi:hypothetical protein